MEVLIITGGSSSERKISLISAKSVQQALREKGHGVSVFDFVDGISALESAIQDCDVVFPVMHGKEGEDGELYAFLQKTGKPYVGSDPAGAKTAFDKILFKQYCDAQQIRSAPWKIIENAGEIAAFGFPSVLKAASGGSSHEVALLISEADVSDTKVKGILALKDRFYVEKMLHGVEITVGVLRDHALPTIEIIPPEGKWFDYENKYSGETREIPFAPSVPENLQKEAQETACMIHQDMKLGSFSRSDFIVEGDAVYILETNTPGGVGLTAESLFPKAGQAAGMTFPELMDRVLRQARTW